MSTRAFQHSGKALALTALVGLSACELAPLDLDLRDKMGALDTSLAAGQAAAPRPEPDNRGVISYPNYQIAVSYRGDTVQDVADRVGIGAAALASYNGLKPTDVLRSGEVLALPTRVSEPSPATGAITSGPIQPMSEIDITQLAGAALEGGSNITTGLVPDDTNMQVVPQSGLEPIKHRVQPGETAFTIARLYNVSIRSLAEWNSLDADFTIRAGQHLLVPVIPRAGPNDRTDVYEDEVSQPGAGSITTPPPPPSASTALPADEPAVVAPVIPQPEPVVAAPEPAPEPAPAAQPADSGGRLAYPVQGSILKPYEKGVNEGIDIAATAGDPVVAAEAGTVGAIVQDTNGVDIIVIKHSGNLLTVYTQVENLSIVKGDRVTRGQVIGTVRAGSPSFVHFEVRVGSNSVDPMDYLN